jgi:hypothetical protein
MTDWTLNTPVALIIFNRPQPTQKVFEAIRQAQPPQLFIIADGPRPDRLGEAEKCAQTRAIAQQVDWECEVYTNYSEQNLGCGLRPASGLDWVFSQVEAAIILEDDCLPHPSFFRFCEELLNRYRDDERIAAICGSNLLFGQQQIDDSYYFSRYSICWGWAGWRRSWRYFDFNLTCWPELRDRNLLKDVLQDEYSIKIWSLLAQETVEKAENGGVPDWWDYQWTFCNFIHRGLSIIPKVNLITNLGHTDEATHTFNEASRFNEMEIGKIEFPLHHPAYMIRNVEADLSVQHSFYDYRPSFQKRFMRKIKKLLKA